MSTCQTPGVVYHFFQIVTSTMDSALTVNLFYCSEKASLDIDHVVFSEVFREH